MNQGEICARHHQTGQPVRVLWQNGRINAILRPNKAVPTDSWIAPALVDLQVNGYGGVDFQQDGLPLGSLVTATRRLRLAGCGRYLLTLITDEWPQMMRRLRHLREMRERSSDLRHAIAGWHIEGPFLSAEPGFCGAHDPTSTIDPASDHLRELREATAGDRVLLTLAPERSNALAAIEEAVSLGITVSLGHTNAPAEVIAEAAKRGATGFTHLGNGCPRTLDRHDNILWRILESRGLTVSLIPDTTHVSPALFRIIHRELSSDRIYYISDAMAAAGMKPGRYRLGRLELAVGTDQIVRLPGKPNFAGSALRPIDGVFRAAGMIGCSWREVWPRFSETPAKLMGLSCKLEPGEPADFCLLNVTPTNKLKKLTVYVNGAVCDS
jgi:N-acetylglucosamine-6-phosphate deacetylase